MPKLLTIRVVQEVETRITQCRDCEHWPQDGRGEPAWRGACWHDDAPDHAIGSLDGTTLPDWCPLPDAEEEANATR